MSELNIPATLRQVRGALDGITVCGRSQLSSLLGIMNALDQCIEQLERPAEPERGEDPHE